jgi:hypothetical protein
MQRIIIFLGPSLDLHEAEKSLAAEYRPPAKRGDITKAADEGAEIIGLIDGVFHQENAVAHREILYAVKKGVKVIGASSMGALRAAEMDTLGMIGIGEIYRMYRDGILESDDEVALVFDPVSGYSLSEPLINIRCTLRNAREAGIIDADAHDALLTAARSIFYPGRMYTKIVSSAPDSVDAGTRERFLAWVDTHACDQKRKDAIAALGYIAKIAAEQ